MIWTLSSLPSKNLPSINIISFDKLAHLFVYSILGILFNLQLKERNVVGNKRRIAFGFLVLSAILDELHQYLIPGRTVSVFDGSSNLLGLFVGYILGYRKHD